MPNPFYGAVVLNYSSTLESVHHAWFPETLIAATIQLTSFWATQQQQPFTRYIAQAYIITRNTPLGPGGFPTPDKLRDSSAWLTTDNVEFHLDKSDTPVITSALGLVFDRSPAAANREEVLRALDFAVYDDNGTVLRTHREVQLYGGKALDVDAIQESVLRESSSAFDRPVKIVPVDLSQVRVDMPLRIDPRTERLVAPDYES